jgi:6-phosphofructokinase 1
LGTARADRIHRGVTGVMVASGGDGSRAVCIEDGAGGVKIVPLDHPWLASTRRVDTGD